MLINITDFRWCENLSDIDLIVPLHGISASNVDTLITSQYVKVSCTECHSLQTICHLTLK